MFGKDYGIGAYVNQRRVGMGTKRLASAKLVRTRLSDQTVYGWGAPVPNMN